MSDTVETVSTSLLPVLYVALFGMLVYAYLTQMQEGMSIVWGSVAISVVGLLFGIPIGILLSSRFD